MKHQFTSRKNQRKTIWLSPSVENVTVKWGDDSVHWRIFFIITISPSHFLNHSFPGSHSTISTLERLTILDGFPANLWIQYMLFYSKDWKDSCKNHYLVRVNPNHLWSAATKEPSNVTWHNRCWSVLHHQQRTKHSANSTCRTLKSYRTQVIT